MFHGIRKRLVGTYLFIIILTVVLIEAIMIGTIHHYYMTSIHSTLKNQAEVVSNFYTSYLSNTDIKSNTGKLLDNFSNLPVQIQIINLKGEVIGDSLHTTFGENLKYSDIKDALAGNRGDFIGKDAVTGESLMAYSIPLRSREGIVGAARFTTSLELTNKTLRNIYLYLILAGVGIILLIFLISLYLSNTIINPIKKITRVSEDMSKGNLSVRADMGTNDEIGLLARTLNHMADEIQKTETLKNEFISSISHELRTPLTSIKGWTMTLADTKPEEHEIIRRGVYIINLETDRLTEMVEELLDFSRIQGAQFRIQKEEADIHKLISEVYEQMKQRALRQGIKLEIDIVEKPRYLQIDTKRIKQVLINLLDNSLKFTAAGGNIKLSTGTCFIKEEEFFYINILDTGCGISPDELNLIKGRFYRGKNASNMSGIGLGLSISSGLVKSHGGILDIQSETGKGTSVTVKLPLKS